MDKMTAGPDRRPAVYAHIFFIVLLAYLAMGPVMEAGFLQWDDVDYVINNDAIKTLSWENIRRIFTYADLKLYTPLVTFSYALEYKLAGLAPAVFHSTNLFLHMFNSLMVYGLGVMLGLGGTAAFVAAVLFGIHPMHVESVAWVAERKDMLYSFFLLAASSSYLLYKDRGQKRYYWLALAGFVLSLLSKPMAVTLPVLFLLFDYLQGRRLDRKNILEKIPFFALSAVFAVYTMMPKTASEPVYSAGLLLRVLAPLYNFAFYLVKLAYPADLSALYVLPKHGVVSLVAYSVVSLLVLFVLFRWFRRNRLVVFGVLYYLVTLLPVIQLVPFGPVISADRYSYMASAGVFWIVGAACAGLLANERKWVSRAALGAGVAVCVALTFAARTRALVWQDSLVFWEDTISKQPGVPMAYVNLGNSYLQLGNGPAALAAYNTALALSPDDDKVYVNRGNAYILSGQPDKALADYRRAVEMGSARPEVYANIANVEFNLGHREKAFEELNKALKLRPNSALLWSALGVYYSYSGKDKEAEASFLRSFSLDPADMSTNYNLCLYYRRTEADKSRYYCARAAKLGYRVAPELLGK